MDVLRNGYKKLMRLWQNDDNATLVRWFRVAPTAKVFTGPTFYRSSVWDKYSHVPPVGEIKDEPHIWDRGLNSAGYAGDHYCGTLSAATNGGVHGIDPPITTNDDGTCDCCDTAKQTNTNGLGVGVAATQLTTAIQYNGIAPKGIQSPAVITGTIGVGVGLVGCQGYLYLSPSALSYGLCPYGSNWLSSYLPGLAHTYLTSVIGLGAGTLFDQGDDDMIVGEIRAFGFNATPTGWLECNGQQVSQTIYANLFAALGSTWGPPGAGMFFLPDLRRQVLMGRGGTASEPPGNALGNQGGSEIHVITANESGLPGHTHFEQVNTPTGGSFVVPGVVITGVNAGTTATIISTTQAGPLDAIQYHNNVQPSTVVKFMIYAGP